MSTSTKKYNLIQKWKANIKKLLFNNDMCCVCLEIGLKLTHWDEIYHVKNENFEVQHSLKDILCYTFDVHVTKLLPTPYLCDKCVTIILKSYILLKNIKHNNNILQKYINVILRQTDQPKKSGNEKQGYYLTIDNVTSLKVPDTVVQSSKMPVHNIILEVNEFMTDSEDGIQNVILNYECPCCGHESDTFQNYKIHSKLHTKEDYLKCYLCAKSFSNMDEILDHRKLIHIDFCYCVPCNVSIRGISLQEHEEKDHCEEIFQCSICNSQFGTKEMLLEHNDVTHNITDAICRHCLQNFTNTFKLNHHRCLYKCLECKDKCVHEQYLISYREQDLAKQKLFKCKDCDFTYTTRNNLISHVNEIHLNHFPYICDLCEEKFASRPLLRIHTYKVHEDVLHISKDSVSKHPYKCDLCENSFNSEDAYISHRKKHSSECQYCSKVFCSISTLNMHLKKHHLTQEEGKGTVYRCSMCKSNFNYKTDYLKHVATHPEGSRHVCRICNDSFLSKTNYYSHVRKHQIKYDKQCHICLKMYTKHTIGRHMKNHRDVNDDSSTEIVVRKNVMSVMCDVCGALLSNEKSLIKHSGKHKEETQCPHCQKYINSVLYARHVKTHTNNDPKLKTCSYCDYTTRFSTCLEGHVNRYHLKIRPYQCEICSKTFYSDYTLKGHKLTHVNERPECYCEVCGKKFIGKKCLMLHTRIHTGERPYPCDLCGLSFLSASRRKQHRIRKHFEPSVECDICKKKLFTQSDLRRHIEGCHGGEPKRKKQKKTTVVHLE